MLLEPSVSQEGTGVSGRPAEHLSWCQAAITASTGQQLAASYLRKPKVRLTVSTPSADSRRWLPGQHCPTEILVLRIKLRVLVLVSDP